MPTHANPPHVAAETWRALFDAASQFLSLKPWKYLYDSQIAGLVDPLTSEIRIGSVLGNRGEIFGATFHRRPSGLNWILRALHEDENPEEMIEGLDCLKLEFVRKSELSKEDVKTLSVANFRPTGRGPVYPQFRSSEPGWAPWYINETEAQQFLADLSRLLAFCHLLHAHPDCYREGIDIPFLPVKLPDRPLEPGDLDWRPFVPPPDPGMQPVSLSQEELEPIARLPQVQQTHEFHSAIFPGVSFLDQGRPSLSRLALLVEQTKRVVIHVEFNKGPTLPAPSAVRALVKALTQAKIRPAEIWIARERLQPVLQPVCDQLGIELSVSRRVSAVESALESLSEFVNRRGQGSP